jgi:hypothetical protein
MNYEIPFQVLRKKIESGTATVKDFADAVEKVEMALDTVQEFAPLVLEFMQKFYDTHNAAIEEFEDAESEDSGIFRDWLGFFEMSEANNASELYINSNSAPDYAELIEFMERTAGEPIGSAEVH